MVFLLFRCVGFYFELLATSSLVRATPHIRATQRFEFGADSGTEAFFAVRAVRAGPTSASEDKRTVEQLTETQTVSVAHLSRARVDADGTQRN